MGVHMETDAQNTSAHMHTDRHAKMPWCHIQVLMYTGHIHADMCAHTHVLRYTCIHIHADAHTSIDTQAPDEVAGKAACFSRCRDPYLGGNEMSSSYSLSLKTDNSLSNSKS